MNEPLISPWVFYLFSILTPLNGVALSLVVLSILTGMYSYMAKEEAEDNLQRIADRAVYERDEEYIKRKNEYYSNKFKRFTGYFNKSITVLCISIMILLFVPNQHTIVQMYIASKITPANINVATELGEKAIDKTINKILEASRKYHEVTHGNNK